MARARAASPSPRDRGVAESAPSAPGTFAWLVAAGVAVVLAPTLARTPQSGDGAEIVSVAVQGGVLHPPGFPLQAWLDRAIALLPVNPSLAISTLGLVLHATAAGLVAATVLALGAGTTSALAAAAAFAFFPPVWGVAVQPEVFAPAIAAAALLLWLAVQTGGRASPGTQRARADVTPSIGAAAIAGLVVGLAAATHPIVLAALPAIVVVTMNVLRPGPRRVARAAAFGFLAVVPPLMLYASMPALRTDSPWPDWGALASPVDVARHVLRLEYGAFSFSAASGERTVSALATWFTDVARTWNVGLVAVAIGAAGVFARGRARAVAVLGTLAVALAILALGRLPEQSYSTAYLEKLLGPATLAAAVLLGLGVEAIRRRVRALLVRRAMDVLVAAAAMAWLVTGWPAANHSSDRTLALHQQGVAVALDDSMVYVTEGDVESFMGVPHAGARRFPVQGPEMDLEWYWRSVAPRLEPRALPEGSLPASWPAFVEGCLARGLPVAGTSRMLVASGGVEPELRGLLYVARPGGASGTTRATVEAALDLDPVTAQLPALPSGRRELSRFYARRFARAYAGAAEALTLAGAAGAAAAAHAVEQSILRGDPARDRLPLLDAFEAECRAAGFR